MRRAFRILALVVAVAAIAVLASLPPAARATAAMPAGTVRGAFHIHSTRSDGSGSVDAIADAAARAGLQFIILTDHGDGTREPDAPAYRNGVLTLDGVELNTTAGHYAVIGMAQSPYPIAGHASDVIDDVRRLGGFGIVAHPGSPRPSLSWQEWETGFDGLEWLNGDSEWRDEPRLPLARALLTYLVRAPESLGRLLDRPDAVFRRWDTLAQTRRVVALAGTDAHARLGFQQRTDPDTGAFHVPIPGYEPSFRALSNHVVIGSPLTGDATLDARMLIDAIRKGRVYGVVDALASPGALSFTAKSGSHAIEMGDVIAPQGDVVMRASVIAPSSTRLVLLRNGARVSDVTDAALEKNVGREPGAYRIEVYTSDAPGGPTVPWIVSNPIYVGLPAPAPESAVVVTARIPARTSEAATEAGANDTSRIEVGPPDDPRARTLAGDPAIHWSFALSGGTPAGQFAAVPIPISPGLDAFTGVQFTVSSPRPMRAWVQLRASAGHTDRWGATFYADAEPRTVTIPFARFRPIGVTGSAAPPLAEVQFLLFVVDTLNALPGSGGTATISNLSFVR